MIAPKPLIIPKKPERPTRKLKRMTIGIGMLCTDGVLLCADRQLTAGGFKFEAVKVSRHASRNCLLSFCYAGVQDDATAMLRIIYDNFDEAFEMESDTNGPINRTLQAFIKIFRDKTAKNLQMLIGVCFPNSACGLIKTCGNRVVVGTTEYIGCGDSSALRYLADFIFPNSNTSSKEADFLACYLCSVATRYIDGCGGGPDRIVLHSNGYTTELNGGPLDNQRERDLYSEQEIGRVMRELIYSGGTRVALTQPASSTSQNQ